MIEDLKFRGMSNGKMFYGTLSILQIDFGPVKAGCYISNRYGTPFAYKVDPETIGQFTGLKEKNGDEIYDGDIIKYTLDEPVSFFSEEIQTEEKEHTDVVEFEEGMLSEEVNCNGNRIADVYRKAGNIEEAEANAKLIAAAPELLEALRSAQLVIPSSHIGQQKVREKIEIVIKKATE